MFAQERLKVEERLLAAQAFIVANQLNEIIRGEFDDVGIIVLGGLANSVLRALSRLGLADLFGRSRIPIYVLNVAYPLAPEELRGFCAGKRAVLVVEEGYPDYIEQAVTVELRRADLNTRVFGKGPLPKTGEYTSDVVLQGLAAFLREAGPQTVAIEPIDALAQMALAHKQAAAAAIPDLPTRPPAFCTGCPEHPSSPRSNLPSARWGGRTSAPTSAAIRLRPCRRSISATRFSAMG